MRPSNGYVDAKSTQQFCLLCHKARYAKLPIIRWKHKRNVSYRRFRKIISLSAAPSISRKIVGYVTSTKHGIEILPVELSFVRRDKGTVISQNYIIKIVRNVSGMPNIIFGLAIFGQCNLSFAKTEFRNLFTPRTCCHEASALFKSYSPIVIDIGIITKADRNFALNRFLVDATYANVCNIA